jgi:hypothetical protein
MRISSAPPLSPTATLCAGGNPLGRTRGVQPETAKVPLARFSSDAMPLSLVYEKCGVSTTTM